MYGLVVAVAVAIVAFGALAWAIVNVGNSEVGNLGLKNVGDVVVEDGYRVTPTHGQGA